MIVALSLMMVFAIYALVLYSVKEYVPKDAVTVSHLFSDGEAQKLNTLKFLEFHPKYIVVEFSGKTYNLKNSSQDGDVLHYCFRVNDDYGHGVGCYTNSLFEIYLSKDKTDFYKADTYYVFNNGVGDETNSLVLYKLDQFSKLTTANAWINTKATVVVWDYPEAEKIVENLSTGEIAFVNEISAIDDSGKTFLIRPGSVPSWGYIDYSFDANTNWTKLTIHESPNN